MPLTIPSTVFFVSSALTLLESIDVRIRSKNSGIRAAETEESVTLGRSRKRKGWDSYRSCSITLGAIGMRVKYYNVDEATDRLSEPQDVLP